MLVVGVALVVFCGWGVMRPDLFEGRALPILGGSAGSFFVLVAVALRRVPRGLDALALEDGCLVMHEAGGRIAIGLANIADVHVVAEPLGRGHPLLCVGTPGGSLIEVSLMRYGHIEPMSNALREDIEEGTDALPTCPLTPLRVTEGRLEVIGSDRQLDLSSVTAVDFVHHLSVHGPGLVVHTEPVEPLEDVDMIDAATVMRRIAAGEHLALPGVTRSAAVCLALHIDRARTMMKS